MTKAFVAVAWGLAVWSWPLAAQSEAPARPVIRGTVVDTSGQPLANVQIGRKGKRGVISDELGRFSVPVEPNEKVQLEIRRLGLHPARYLAAAPPDTAVTLVMYYAPVVLPAVAAKAARRRDLERAGFYSRLADSEKGALTGTFLTPEYLDRRNGQRITQLLENVPGVEVRVGMGGRDSPMLRGLNGCMMNVWLNGVNLRPDSSMVPSQRWRLDMSKKVGNVLGPAGQLPISYPFNMQLDEIIQGSAVSAIEVYPRLLQVPDRFRTIHADCGAVIIWLKGHDSY